VEAKPHLLVKRLTTYTALGLWNLGGLPVRPAGTAFAFSLQQ